VHLFNSDDATTPFDDTSHSSLLVGLYEAFPMGRRSTAFADEIE